MTNDDAPTVQPKPDAAYPLTYPTSTADPTESGTTDAVVPEPARKTVPEPVPEATSLVPAHVPGLEPPAVPVPDVLVGELVPVPGHALCARCKRELSRKRRRRAAPARQHPGVVIMRPDEHGHGWRVRYFDPNLKRTVKVAIEPDKARDEPSRIRFAKKLSSSLQEIKSEIKATLGRALQVETITLEAARQAYWDAHPNHAGSTRSHYAFAFAFLVDPRPKMLTREIAPALLDTTRANMINRCKPDGEPLVESTHNRNLIVLRGLVHYWRTTGRLHPDLHSDRINAALKLLTEVHERKEFLAPPAIAQLLEACRQYDADNPSAPFGPLVRAWLLTGLRHGELLRVERPWINRELARIDMRAAATKTKILRNVDLSVAPTAFPLDLDPSQPGLVFADWTPDRVYTARDVTIEKYGAPEWSPQSLRRTCASYFSCAFGSARSARSLGHSIEVADKSYVGAVAIPPGAVTLEQAMRLEPVPSAT